MLTLDGHLRSGPLSLVAAWLRHHQQSLTGYGQRWRRQYRAHFTAYPLRTIAQLKSVPDGVEQNAAVRLPPAEPADRQSSCGP